MEEDSGHDAYRRHARPGGTAAPGRGDPLSAERLKTLLEAGGIEPELEEYRAASLAGSIVIRAGMRVVAAVLLLVDRPLGALVFAAASLVAEILAADGRDVMQVPGRGTETNVIGNVPAASPTDHPPVVVICPTGSRLDSGGLVGPAAAMVVVVLSVLAFWFPETSRIAVAVPVVEAAARALRVVIRPAPGETVIRVLAQTGLFARERPPRRPLWLVGTPSVEGLLRFLDARRELAREAWLVVVDGCATPELAVVPGVGTIRRREAHPVLVRAVSGAALETGEAIDVVRSARGSDLQNAALARGLSSVTLSVPPRTDAVRPARLLHRLARTVL